MAITQTITQAVSSAGGTLTGSVVVSGGEENNFSATIPASTTNQVVLWAFTLAKLLSVCILSNVTLTLKTNSSGSPQETITITAGCPFVWYSTSGLANPFGGNVTTTYWTNGTATAADLEIRSVVVSP